MTTLVVDASVAAKWLFTEEHSAVATLLLPLGGDLIAPDFIVVEIANILRTRYRAQAVSAIRARSAVSELRSFVTLAPSGQLLAAALDIGMEHNRSVYDALYVALALREGCRLVTADRRLYQALDVLSK